MRSGTKQKVTESTPTIAGVITIYVCMYAHELLVGKLVPGLYRKRSMQNNYKKQDVDIKPTVESILEPYSQNGDIDYIALLQEIQDRFRYVPAEALKLCSEKLDVPLNNLYSMVTFYSCFSLVPRGKHEIQVCMGTACHVRGAPVILEKLSRELHLEPGETDENLRYTLETVNCVGACAMGPLVAVNQVYRGRLNINKLDLWLKELGEDMGGEHAEN